MLDKARGLALFMGAMLMMPPAFADSICGPGQHLASNAFACLPGDGGSDAAASSSGSDIATGLAVGSVVLSLVNALASETRITDDAGPAPSVHEGKPLTLEEQQVWHGTRSWQYNREGIALQQSGDFEGARRAFNKAADEASAAGNHDDMVANMDNANIADALHWLRAGFEAEQAGQITRANISYKMGIDAARLAGNEQLAAQLGEANSRLVDSNGDDGALFQNEEVCDVVNGEYSCRLP